MEAVTNSILHAYRGTPGRPVRVQIVARAERIELRIGDRGAPVPEECRSAPPKVDPAAPEALTEGGRGLFLMHSLMDEVAFGLEDGWNIVTFKKRRTPA